MVVRMVIFEFSGVVDAFWGRSIAFYTVNMVIYDVSGIVDTFVGVV